MLDRCVPDAPQKEACGRVAAAAFAAFGCKGPSAASGWHARWRPRPLQGAAEHTARRHPASTGTRSARVELLLHRRRSCCRRIDWMQLRTLSTFLFLCAVVTAVAFGLESVVIVIAIAPPSLSHYLVLRRRCRHFSSWSQGWRRTGGARQDIRHHHGGMPTSARR